MNMHVRLARTRTAAAVSLSHRIRSGSALFFLALLFTAGPMRLACAGRPGLDRNDFRQVIHAAKDEVFPTVIFIQAVRETMERGERDSQTVTGSGVLVSETGEALSNWHVVDRAQQVRCMLYDGRAFDATVVGSDKDTDLALLQLDLPPDAEPLPFARLGDSNQATEGDFVMAMGAPWGLSRSVSIGIVSCARRYLPDHSEYNLWLQTDAAISPGNSGGPLVDTHGKVIGINTLGTLIGGDTGFAIPSAVIRDVLEPLRKQGHVDWAWTGLDLQPLNDFKRNVYFGHTRGVMMAGTAPGSPARRAGILTGDRLLAVNGRAVTALTEEALPDLRRQLGLLPKDKPATLQFMRDDQLVSLVVTPTQKGRVEGDDLEFPRWDFTAKAINRFDNPGLFFYRPQGVFVYGIKHPGNAQRSGLAQRDILLRIGPHEIHTLADAERAHREALEGLPGDHRVLVAVLRNGMQRQLVLDYARDFSRE